MGDPEGAHLVRAGLATVPLLLGWTLFGSAIVDDAHISYVVADRLAETGRVVNNAGEAVEQSSSLLHVLVLGALHRLTGVALPTLGWWVGALAAAALVWVAWGVVVEDFHGSLRAAALAGVLVAMAPGVVLWSVAGLETTLAALVLLLVLRSWWRAADSGWSARGMTECTLGAAAVALVRPEGPLLLLAVTLGLGGAAALWGDGVARRRIRSATSVILAPLVGLHLGTAAVVAVRLLVFSRPVPQPAATKGGGLDVARGWTYLWRRLVSDPGTELLLVAAVAVVLLALLRRRRAYAVAVLGSAVAAVLCFVVLAGGDWMPGPRLLLPAVAPAVILVAVTVRLRSAVVGVLVGTQILGMGMALRVDQVGTPLWYREEVGEAATEAGVVDVPWALRSSRIAVRDLALAPALRHIVDSIHGATGRPTTVASYQAGLLASDLAMTFGDDVELVDLARLTSRRFDDCDHVLVHTVFGEVVESRAWLNDANGPCGVDARPDVFFGLGDPADQPWVGKGYVVVARTTGEVTEGGRLAGRPLSAAQFVAVRPELADVAIEGAPLRIEMFP